MASSNHLEAHARPPEPIRQLFKKFQKSNREEIEKDHNIVISHTGRALDHDAVRWERDLQADDLAVFFRDFLGNSPTSNSLPQRTREAENVSVYAVNKLPGLFIVPELFPPLIQVKMLDRLLHRDLSNPLHKTNLHLHYNIPYREGRCPRADQDDTNAFSFFGQNPSTIFTAKNSTVHTDITMEEVLVKKLRWVTLGGQYDWTAKRYPTGHPPTFPKDIGDLLRRIFTDIDPQAAILNLYTPKDTLSAHRDVSEECDRDLVSMSIGCDAIFVVGDEDGSNLVTLRLKSGDAVCMTGPSRFAWHAVPKVLSGTCPTWLQDWPAIYPEDTELEHWRGWMANKRINLNVRQMTIDS